MVSVPYTQRADTSDVTVDGDTASLDLWYPGLDGRVTYLEVGLMAVRAADSLRLHYDFTRDGWSIEQASTFAWPSDDPICDPDWQEVAFIQAWARDKEHPSS